MMIGPNDKKRFGLLLILIFPTLFWSLAVKHTEVLYAPKWKALLDLVKATPEKPPLLLSAITGLLFAILLILLISQIGKSQFGGAYFRNFLRGTKIVSKEGLCRKTREMAQQIDVAGVPMPSKVENLHLLVNGATGSGKSVLLRSLAWSGLKRRDRFIFVDPNGDMLSKFHQEGDVILNPYDARTKGWSFFNEIRNDYDFERYALSIVPRGQSEEAEEWASYARLLLRETARKLQLMAKPSIPELFRWTTIAQPEDLKAFLAGTVAESLFVGADKALASARFVLSDKLPQHLNMPTGDFSLRVWLDNPTGGNLYITWREDMAEALKPLISAWVDVLCTSILSLPEDEKRKLWMIIDELASLEKLASLNAALTKGRKHGLRIVAGLQSTSQLDKIYGEKEAQTLRACFRSLVVLGGSKADHKTCEDMSKSLGDHEVERDTYGKTFSIKRDTTSRGEQRKQEHLVLPSEIASLPDLTGYLAFSGDYPITKFKLTPLSFKNRIPGIEEMTYAQS
jgi:type IV secretory pathway TraG/TraD family ATPase VirD4